MSTQYNLPAIFSKIPQADYSKYASLPYFIVMNEIKQYVKYNQLDKLFGSIPWQENMGNNMDIVIPERSPVGRSFFRPNAITGVANMDIYETTESQRQTQLYWHKYTSKIFNFLPNFSAFWTGRIKFNSDDVAFQVALSNDQFIETKMWDFASYIYLCGTGLYSGAPTGTSNDTNDAPGSKTAAFLVGLVKGAAGGSKGVTQNLTLRDLNNAWMNLQNDLGAPSFDGTLNTAKDDEGVKGKYVLRCGNETWANFRFDRDVTNKLNGLAPCDLNLVTEYFHGNLFGFITTQVVKYTVRFSDVDILNGDNSVRYAAGTPIDPEIFNPNTQEWIPNPYYNDTLSAKYAINWLLGGEYCKTISVGAPPKEFTKTMEPSKFYSMNWNGKPVLTDQIIIKYPSGDFDLNEDGENLRIKATVTHGFAPLKNRFAFPIIERRVRPSVISI